MNNYDSFHQLDKKGHYFNYYNWIDDIAFAATPTNEQLSPGLMITSKSFSTVGRWNEHHFYFCWFGFLVAIVAWLGSGDRKTRSVARKVNGRRCERCRKRQHEVDEVLNQALVHKEAVLVRPTWLRGIERRTMGRNTLWRRKKSKFYLRPYNNNFSVFP